MGLKYNQADKKHPLYRKVTHTKYTGIKKIGDKGPQSWLQRVIVPLSDYYYKGSLEYPVMNDEYLKRSAETHITPIIGGGMSLFAIVLYTFFSLKKGTFGDEIDVILYFVLWLIVLFFVVYYFTMPKKEEIFNRMDGTITFPGFLWKKNITMPFDKIKFSYTSGGPNMIGAYQLTIVRPDKAGSWLRFPFGGMDCYQDLAHLTWYMDKNRPLPPVADFDQYRQKDFERRKKAKFKKPLYTSQIPTPEATPEQQKERERIGKW